tara:strand:- start:6 stop:143 length:138 start_codon:yes stop_codon:yes gene_type:complete
MLLSLIENSYERYRSVAEVLKLLFLKPDGSNERETRVKKIGSRWV